MFGYVRPLKGELKVREYEEYKAVYCTLCRELGKNYGRRMRFALSYDLTYYTLLALDLSGAEPSVRKGRCPLNPAKKCRFLCEGEEAYRKGAALTVLMTYHKLRDTVADEGWGKRTAARFLLLFVRGPYKKAARQFPELSSAIEAMMAEQARVEQEENASLDACCEPTANALAAVFSELGRGKDQKLVLRELGYFLGRWVYLMDAADDLKEDLERGKFNPLARRLELKKPERTEKSKRRSKKEQPLFPPEEQNRIDLACNEILNFTVSRINSALNLLNLGKYGDIITNVSRLGFAEMQREILFLHIHEKKQEKF